MEQSILSGDGFRATEKEPAIEFRKLDVAVRETDYVAGNANVTAIVIRNTYPIPIRLISVTARHSTLNSMESNPVFKGSIEKRVRPSRTRVRIRIHNVFPFNLFERYRSRYPFLDLMHDTTTIVETEPLYIKGEKGSSIEIDDHLSTNREIYVTAEEGAQIALKKSHDGQTNEKIGSYISPMSEVVSEYVWRTNHWVLFIPARIGIDIAIRYEIGGETRSQVVSSMFDIKPPIHSVVLGGVAGGIIGSLARSFTEADSLDINTRFFVKLIGSCLLSIMAVISLSRKSGSQSFITVEDFFGSFVLGSLIGYEGTTFFDKTVINGKDSG